MTVPSKTGAQGVVTAGAIEITAARLDAPPDTVPALYAWLSAAERQRAGRFHFDRDRRRFIVARSRLRELLAKRLGVAPGAVEIVSGRNGKPELAPRFAGSAWAFNVSHSEELAVYALARGCEVGIDVEAVRTLPEADDIAARFFSPRENADYRAAAPQNRALAFLRCWTRKEALVKALAAGVCAPLEALDASRPEPRSGWRIESFSPRPGFIAAVASLPA